MTIDVCLEMVHTDLPYEKRIEKIAQAGFKCVEFWMHDAKDAAVLRQVCEATGVTINNLVVNSPDGSVGGGPVDSRDHGKYIDRLHEVIAFAKAANINMGITCTGNLVDGLSRNEMRENLEKAYAEAAAIAAKHDFTLVLESLNTLVNHPGYFLDSSLEGAEIVRAVGSPNFKLLYDIYHMQIMEGNVIANIERNIDVIGHFHSAGVPGRHELIDCELNYLEILKRIDAAGYTGAFGLEYSPSYDSTDSLRATRAYFGDFR
jgi:hydroxypyruvate isomerase